MTDFDSIGRALAARPPHLLSATGRAHAAVALLLREAQDDLEVLFIVRAPHEADPWSGDLAFPGGRIEAEDKVPRRAAERETLEEIGLDLAGAHSLGRLDDISGAHLPVLVSCFVYALRETPQFALNHEVSDAFWFPLKELCSPHRHLDAPVRFGAKELVRPAIDLLGPDRPVLWGITYRLVAQFLCRLGHPIPPTPVD